MSMFQTFKKELEWEGRPLSIESGKIARQADGAVIVKYGDTTVLAAVTAAKGPSDFPFFPLTVHYLERYYAAGKIPGGFFKREARPTEKETLTSRLIDRPIRPLFPDGFRNETQVVCQVLSHDLENDPDMVAMIAASAALTLSGVPFFGPIGAARVAYIDGKYVVNPLPEELEESALNLVVAGTKEGVLMVESEAKELSEDVMLGAVMHGYKSFQPVIDAIIELAENCAKEPWNLAEKDDKAIKAVKDKIKKAAGKDIEKAYAEVDKQTRTQLLADARAKITEAFEGDEETPSTMVSALTKKMEAELVRDDILSKKTRIDGRGLADIRQINAETGLLPRTHGSALFTRGETQALCVATLGTGQDEQRMDGLEGEHSESFMLHYNFPPYSVGEAGRMGPPGRREIGHGKLAWRALHPLMPSKEEFPYTVRIVSEITESNGSSSMATVCGASLAMMDAGVPLPKPVAGIAMGLIKEGKDFAVLSDIMGDEDHLGDMDFKVAGSADGLTALQMDIKITSITEEIMKIALEQAKEGRLHILREMDQGLTGAREEISEFAPQMISLKIAQDKIREVIGTGGKVIREITETTGAKIDIEDDGSIRVSAVNLDDAQKAVDWINSIVAEPEEGKVYKGKVAKIMDFGAFVDFMGKSSGLVHISQISNERVGSVTDVLSEGDDVYVKLIGFDHRGKVKLAMKGVNQKTGEEDGSSGDNNGDAAKAAS